MTAKFPVVFCWHMHQPQYWDPERGVYHLPWTYLHAVKDYVDMAVHLAEVPAAKAVVNFAPILLEQLDDYANQVRHFLEAGTAICDPLLNALAQPILPSDPEQRLHLVRACLRANEKRLINRFPGYRRLVSLIKAVTKEDPECIYLNDRFLADLLVWYHLAWIAETVRRSNPRIKQLEAKKSGYSYDDRRALVALIGELIGSVIPRYRALAQSGQVELSLSPYAHPIVPLLIDMKSAREAMPGVHLPAADVYPDGTNRAKWHIERGLEVFEKFFGFRPPGCWPSEGSVSVPTVELLGTYGFRWCATGEQVLRRTLSAEANARPNVAHRPYAISQSGPACFFRDDGLSDLIGFTYSEWHADDAVGNLVQHLETIANNVGHDRNAVVSIIMDGENAWEYYPENGYYFLAALYQRLSNHPRLQLTTFSQVLSGGVQPEWLGRLISGSWVYGTFSTWIGDKDKNHAWEMLSEAKNVCDQVLRSGTLTPARRAAVEQQLAICEGSDWFWWFGDYNPAEAVADFDRLYRIHLQRLYTLLEQRPPGYLAHAFSHGTGKPESSGVMRRGKE